MPQKKHKAEEIVAKLRQVDVLLSQNGWRGGSFDRRNAVHVLPVCKEFGGLKGDQVKRLNVMRAIMRCGL